MTPKRGWNEFNSSPGPHADNDDHQVLFAEKSAQRVIVKLVRNGKAGKTVTEISGLQLDQCGYKLLLRKLKIYLGSGGTTKNKVIALQGDQVDTAIFFLTNEGYKPKRAGR